VLLILQMLLSVKNFKALAFRDTFEQIVCRANTAVSQKLSQEKRRCGSLNRNNAQKMYSKIDFVNVLLREF